MRILLLLTWYTPHLSGLTIAASHVASGLRALGHNVTVLTSRHSRELPDEEVIHGVRVLRSRVIGRLSKGLLLPGYIPETLRLASEHDIVVAFLPAGPAECIAAALAARKRPLVVEYICDIQLPGGWPARAIERLSGYFFHLAVRAAAAVIVHTDEYAKTSPLLSRYPDKVRIGRLPIRMSLPRPDETAGFRAAAQNCGPIIGIAARLAADKGFELLLDALPLIRKQFPTVRVLWAGNYQTVVGEEAYRAAILPRIERLGDQWRKLGVVKPDLASFFAACDVLVLPSVNRTESFGMVQAEAMLCGTPVVASDLPGVRVPVQSTGMGKLFRSGDVESFALAVISVLENRAALVKPRDDIQRIFSEKEALEERVRVFQELLSR